MGISQILPGVWRLEALHPDWEEAEGGEDGWEASGAGWALVGQGGLLLVDPRVDDWSELDCLVETHGGCAGVVRTVHWHQRDVPEAAGRYGAAVWAAAPPRNGTWPAFDEPLVGERSPVGVTAYPLARADEVALWFASHAALLFGDAMLRRPSGELHICPESWLSSSEEHERMRAQLRALTRLPVEHLLLAHGSPVLGNGAAALTAAL